MTKNRTSNPLTKNAKQQGVLLVGHGTRDERGQGELLETARMVSRQLPEVVVEPCFLELAMPDIAAGIERLVTRGVRQITVLPLLLFAAGHAKRDIPQTAQAAAAHYGLPPPRQSPHLGCHPAMIELSAQRFQEALGHDRLGSDPEGMAGETLLLMVGRGSQDRSALDEMQRFVELRCRSTPVARAMTAFLAMAEPSLDQALAELASTSFPRIVVQPHLLFQGDLLAGLHRQVQAMAERLPERHWTITEHLGPSPLLVEALVDNFRQARVA